MKREGTGGALNACSLASNTDAAGAAGIAEGIGDIAAKGEATGMPVAAARGAESVNGVSIGLLGAGDGNSGRAVPALGTSATAGCWC